MPMISLLNNSGNNQPVVKEYRRVHVFRKSIRLKVSIIVRLDFKLTYENAAVPHASLYVKGTPCHLYKTTSMYNLKEKHLITII